MTRSVVDRIASVAWYYAVERGLGLSSPSAVELLLEGERVKPDADGIKRPRKYRHYRDGKRTPDDFPGTLNVIEIAERAAPGTARWFRSPAWKVLNGDFDNRYDLRDLIFQHPAIASKIISIGEPLAFDVPAENGLPALSGSAPTQSFEIDRISDCVELEGLDLIEAVVLLLEYGNLKRQHAVTARALDLYGIASEKISKIPEIRVVVADLFNEIDGRFADFVGLPADEIFPPWHVRLPHLLEQIYDVDAMRKEALAWDGEIKLTPARRSHSPKS